MGTLFTDVYSKFFSKITDDMYLELTPRDTLKNLRSLIINAIPCFEFPRKVLSYTLDETLTEEPLLPEEEMIAQGVYPLNAAIEDGELHSEQPPAQGNVVVADTSAFDVELTDEEQNILAILMMCGWLQCQITSIENTRMKYSGSDYKLSSQANHLAKLVSLLNECQKQDRHFQRLYKRRYTDEDGQIHSNWRVFGRSHHGIRDQV